MKGRLNKKAKNYHSIYSFPWAAIPVLRPPPHSRPSTVRAVLLGLSGWTVRVSMTTASASLTCSPSEAPQMTFEPLNDTLSYLWHCTSFAMV